MVGRRTGDWEGRKNFGEVDFGKSKEGGRGNDGKQKR
jgi:hypothetical protein